MKGIRTATQVITELAQYFLQKSFFKMLINHALNEKGSKISGIKNVNNPTLITFA